MHFKRRTCSTSSTSCPSTGRSRKVREYYWCMCPDRCWHCGHGLLSAVACALTVHFLSPIITTSIPNPWIEIDHIASAIPYSAIMVGGPVSYTHLRAHE